VGELEFRRLRVEVEPLCRHSFVIWMKIINSLVGQLLDLGSMRLNLDIVETDRLGTLAVDVGSEVLDLADPLGFDDFSRRSVEHHPLSRRIG